MQLHFGGDHKIITGKASFEELLGRKSKSQKPRVADVALLAGDKKIDRENASFIASCAVDR